jgi:DNA-directed RNA polymerase II subunit RPB2
MKMNGTYQKWGDTEMISGMTGEIMKAKIYMCPTYYQALRHMVDDKIHARSQNGPRDILSMQPIDGRRRGGGFRVGEMECWASISHGASNFLIDRLVNNSDSYEYYVCDDCGNAAVANLTNKTFNCRLCHQSSRISKVVIPYSFKLMQQELMATGIGVWVEV